MAGLPRYTAVLSAALMALLSVAPAHAQQQDAAAAAADVPAVEVSALAKKFPALADFEKQGGIVEYLGPSGSLEGFVLIGADKTVKTVYVTPENTMVMGILVGTDGQNLTAPQLMAYRKRLGGDQSAIAGAESGAVSKAEQVYAGAEKSAWVQVGQDSAPYIYMFMNVNCDHCKAMFMDVAPLVKAGKIQIRLVPFGTAEANRDGGAALLSVSDPFAAWQAYINGDSAALGKDKIAAGALDKIAANTAFATTNKLQGPPFTLYRRPADGVITAMVGRPQNTLALMADLLPPDLPVAPMDVPQQPQAQPDVAPATAPEATP